MHELYVYRDHGLIDWVEKETDSYEITKGKVICFEKSIKKFILIRDKIVGSQFYPKEIGDFLREKYKGFMDGQSTKIFPVNVVNLDFDSNLSKSKVRIDEIVNLILQYQEIHDKPICLFITFPETEQEDEEDYKSFIRQVIDNNLSDANAVSFSEEFNSKHESIDKLNYENLTMIGSNDHFLYGGENLNRKRMISMLFYFERAEANTAEHNLYREFVHQSLVEPKDLSAS